MHKHTHFSDELWKPIPNYEGFYEVSDHGRVRSVDRLIVQKTGQTYWIRGKSLRPSVQKSGHLHFTARKWGEAKIYMVHRAVLDAFVGACPEGMEACHNDGDPSNNRLSNLRWDTYRENNLDRVRMGTHNNTRKTHCPQGHLLTGCNLIPSALKIGQRVCLACNRARAYLRNKPQLKGEFQKIADEHYRLIMDTP